MRYTSDRRQAHKKATMMRVLLLWALATLACSVPVPHTIEYTITSRASVDGTFDGISFFGFGFNTGVAASNGKQGVATGASDNEATPVLGLAMPNSALAVILPSPSP